METKGGTEKVAVESGGTGWDTFKSKTIRNL